MEFLGPTGEGFVYRPLNFDYRNTGRRSGRLPSLPPAFSAISQMELATRPTMHLARRTLYKWATRNHIRERVQWMQQREEGY